MKWLKHLTPPRLIALGFAAMILLGSGLLMLPASIQEGVQVRYIDALYTSASAVCVTGLIAIDPGDTFTPLGQTILALLIQVGGLGVTAGTAINALQQAGSKIARWHTERFKEAFREMVEMLLWILSEYMEPGRVLRIVGSDGGELRDRLIELAAPGEARALERPAYTVRVQVVRSNPDQIARDNEFLLQAAQICAQAGTPLPAAEIIRLMQGQRLGASVMRAMERTTEP